MNSNPTTSSLRHFVKRINSYYISKRPMLKTEILGIKNPSGRNSCGKITVFHKGGGHKKNYRKIKFSRNFKSTGVVINIEYDPNRNADIAAIYDSKKKKYYYIISPLDLKIGDVVKSGVRLPEPEIRLGYATVLRNIPLGSAIHNVSLLKDGFANLNRSAGTFAHLLEKKLTECLVELHSGKRIRLSSECFATLGIVSNDLHFVTELGKAGRARWLNRRPTVRGVAMNPVDHPHGGGEGKKSGKKYTPWGKAKPPKRKSVAFALKKTTAHLKKRYVKTFTTNEKLTQQQKIEITNE